VRAIVVIATLALAAAVRHWPAFFLRHYTVCMCACSLGWGAGIVGIIMLSSPTDLAWGSYYAGLLIVSMALYAWTYLRPLHAGLIGAVLVAGYVLEALFVQRMGDRGQWPLLAQNTFFLVVANLIGVVPLVLRERFSRQAFLLKNALAHDLKLEEEAKRQSQHLSEHDVLTGLPNRLHFLRRLDELLAARHGAETVAVLFLDLDGFKTINDTHGHATGDEILKMVAQRLVGCARKEDTVSRVGGDEFVIVMGNIGHLGDTQEPAAKLIEAVSEPYVINGLTLRLSTSIGIGIYPDDAGEVASVIAAADAALYEAKRSGKNRSCSAQSLQGAPARRHTMSPAPA
jgi:diguanylate cyclase (GGDEF)-like protein